MEFAPSTKRSTRRIVHAVLVILLSFGLGLLTLPAGNVRGYTSDVLSAFGTATIDGVISPGEYGSCIGPITQGIYVFTICETNDNHNDSYAIQINDLTGPSQDDLAAIFFDNGKGSIAACGSGVDDLLLVNGTIANPQFVDANYCATSGWNLDVFSGGTNDATAAVKFTPGVGYVYEVTHPLDSGDSKDYALTTSSRVGWCFIYYDGPSGTPQVQYPSGCFGAGPSVPSTAAGFGVVQKLSATTALTGTTFTTSAGGFSSLTASTVSSISPPPPAGLTFPDGLFSFTILGLSANQHVTVTITLPAPLPAGSFSYWKFQSGKWTQFPSASLDSTRTTITLTFTADASGVVTDPGGPAITAIIPEYPLGLPLLVIFMILAYGLIKRRTRNPESI
jgi:hypothetical protein